jgi:hypothetical protein
MTAVGSSLQSCKEAHWSGQTQAAVYTGVAQGTLSEIRFIPGYLQTAGQHVQPVLGGAEWSHKADYLVQEFLEGFQSPPTNGNKKSWPRRACSSA